MSTSMRCSVLCLALACGSSAAADVVRTTDGRMLVGGVTADGGGLRVVGAEPVVVPLADVLDVTLDHRVTTAGESCVLADGTTLAGTVASLDAGRVRVRTATAGTLAVRLDRVARVGFTPVPGDLLGRVPKGAAGLLLRDGDFFEGALVRFDGATVTMSSPLLGEAAFGVADRAAALVLRPAGRADGAWVVRTTDGCVLATATLSVAGGAVRADVAGVGPVAVRWGDVAEVRAGGGRVVSLAGLTPAAGAATAGGTPVGLPARLVGGAVGPSVCVTAGTSVTYRLDGTATAFACRVGVPAGVVPSAGVRWAVRLDGRPVAASGGPRTSVDDPVAVDVPVAGEAELTLSAEADVPGVGGVVLFADPVLVRAGK